MILGELHLRKPHRDGGLAGAPRSPRSATARRWPHPQLLSRKVADDLNDSDTGDLRAAGGALAFLRLQSVCSLGRIGATSRARERSRRSMTCGFAFVAGTGFEPVTS